MMQPLSKISENESQHKPRRIRLATSNQNSRMALINGGTKPQQMPPDQIQQLNEAKIRSSSVVSTGDSSKQRGLLNPNNSAA